MYCILGFPSDIDGDVAGAVLGYQWTVPVQEVNEELGHGFNGITLGLHHYPCRYSGLQNYP